MTVFPNSVPVVIAKIKPEVEWGEAKDLRSGSKHFKANAKVYIIGAHRGSCQTVIAIGHHRKSGRIIRIQMQIKYFQDFKLGYLYSKKGLSLYHEFFEDILPGYRPTEEMMAELVMTLPNW
jgi:hypothetical protein